MRKRIAPPGAGDVLTRDLLVPLGLGLLLWLIGGGLVWWWL